MFLLLAATDNPNVPFKRPRLEAQPPAHPCLPEAASPPMPSAEEGDEEGVSSTCAANAQCALRPGTSSSRETPCRAYKEGCGEPSGLFASRRGRGRRGGAWPGRRREPERECERGCLQTECARLSS